MAGQRTGAEIISLARVFAQDNDASSNYAVSDADALILLNDVLMRWTTNVKSKGLYLGASATGLTFTSGTVYKETGDNTASGMRITEFTSFHPSNSSTLSFPVAPALERVSVQDIQAMLGYDGDTALSASANEWTHVAAEKTQDATSSGQEKWRVWTYPVINRTRYLNVLVPVYTQLSASTVRPDIEEADANTVARFLAYEMACLKREADPSKRDSILALVPKEVVQQMQGGAIAAALAQDRVDWRDW